MIACPDVEGVGGWHPSASVCAPCHGQVPPGFGLVALAGGRPEAGAEAGGSESRGTHSNGVQARHAGTEGWGEAPAGSAAGLPNYGGAFSAGVGGAMCTLALCFCVCLAAADVDGSSGG
jgi:hypothetical protein